MTMDFTTKENVNDVPQNVIDAGRDYGNRRKQGFGVAGFDLLVDDNNDVYAIDLNFRQNGSTRYTFSKRFNSWIS